MSIEIPVSPYTLGIDLGTTNSSAAIYSKGSAFALKIANESYTLPSVVWFPDKKKTDVKVGKEAKQKILVKPEEVFSSVKSLMRDEKEWKDDEALKAKFEAIEDGDVTPMVVITEILREIINQAQTQTAFDLEGDIEQVVICVPANTTDTYRTAIYHAARSVGLGVKQENGEVLLEDDKPVGVRILEEPTAAALAYGVDQGFTEDGANKQQNLLVYDMGGGTFDVTILEADAAGEGLPKFTVKATKGIAKLGGDDFDGEIMKIAAEHFKSSTDIDLMDSKADNNGTSGAVIKEAQQKLKEHAEEAKKALAAGSKTHEIIIPNLLKDGDGTTHQLELEIKRSDFLERIKPLLIETQDCVKDALDDANLTIDDINRVILVGGSTRADWVIESVEELGKRPFVSENVDIMVARGAAFYGQSVPVGNSSGESGVNIETATTHHMGIEVEGGKFSLMMEKDLEIPSEDGLSVTKPFYNQEQRDSVWITVYKTQDIEVTGEKGEKVPERQYYVGEKKENGEKRFECIGELHLNGIPKAPHGTEEIEVTMKTYEDQRLVVTAKIKSTGNEVEVELKR